MGVHFEKGIERERLVVSACSLVQKSDLAIVIGLSHEKDLKAVTFIDAGGMTLAEASFFFASCHEVLSSIHKRAIAEAIDESDNTTEPEPPPPPEEF